MNNLTEIFILEDESLTLECNYVGFPVPNITWTHNDLVIINDSGSSLSIVIIKSETNGTSRLRRISMSSNNIEGRYTCILSNDLGTANTTYIVMKTSKFHECGFHNYNLRYY